MGNDTKADNQKTDQRAQQQFISSTSQEIRTERFSPVYARV